MLISSVFHLNHEWRAQLTICIGAFLFLSCLVYYSNTDLTWLRSLSMEWHFSILQLLWKINRLLGFVLNFVQLFFFSLFVQWQFKLVKHTLNYFFGTLLNFIWPKKKCSNMAVRLVAHLEIIVDIALAVARARRWFYIYYHLYCCPIQRSSIIHPSLVRSFVSLCYEVLCIQKQPLIDFIARS